MKILIDKNNRRFYPERALILDMKTGEVKPFDTPRENLGNNDVPFNGNVMDFPEAIALLGVHEIEIDNLPEGVTDATHYIHYPDEAPYINWIEKPARQLAQANNADILRYIDALERQSLMPRAMREFLLGQADAAQQPWYAKVKGIDDQIVALKAGLVEVPPEVVAERPE